MKKEHFFQYNSANYNELFRHLKDGSYEGKLILLAGVNNQLRKQAIDEISREFYSDIIEVHLEDVIVKNEEESFELIDALFESIPESSELIVFHGGDNLNGVYTSFSYSVENYASPQEKYFLNKLQDLKALSVIEYSDVYNLDSTIVRSAEAVITFNPPTSILERFFWVLSQFRVNGSRLPSKRPI